MPTSLPFKRLIVDNRLQLLALGLDLLDNENEVRFRNSLSTWENKSAEQQETIGSAGYTVERKLVPIVGVGSTLEDHGHLSQKYGHRRVKLMEHCAVYSRAVPVFSSVPT